MSYKDLLKVSSLLYWFICLFDLRLSILVNSYGHVRMLPPFYDTQNVLDNITTQAKPAYMYVWFDLNHFPIRVQMFEKLVAQTLLQ